MSKLPPETWIHAARALADILRVENAALRAIDFQAATAQLPAKRVAVKALESLQPAGPKPELQKLVHTLDQLAAENRLLLTRSIGIQSQVLGIIANATRVATQFGYNATGKSALARNAYSLSAKA